MSAGELVAHCTKDSIDFPRGFGGGPLTEIPRCDPFSCFCRAAYSWVLYWQNNMKEACISFTLASLHMPRAINVAPTTPPGQRNLLQSMWALDGQFSLKKWQPQKEIRLSCSCHCSCNCSCKSCLHWHPFKFFLLWSFSLFLLARKEKIGSAVSYNT